MSGSFVTLGKIVTAESQAAARELFSRRYQLGIGGVIFTPDFKIPEWTNDEKRRLADFHCEVAEGEEDDARLSCIDDWNRISRNISQDLVRLSRDFNRTSNTRRIRFLWDDDFDLKPHFDLGALDGWAHLHISGGGMLCANPIGNEPVQVKTTGSFGENIDTDDFERLHTIERKFELVELQEMQAIVFDHRMGHLSGKGKRFRIPTFG